MEEVHGVGIQWSTAVCMPDGAISVLFQRMQHQPYTNHDFRKKSALPKGMRCSSACFLNGVTLSTTATDTAMATAYMNMTATTTAPPSTASAQGLGRFLLFHMHSFHCHGSSIAQLPWP